jgi:hypothetical protein
MIQGANHYPQHPLERNTLIRIGKSWMYISGKKPLDPIFDLCTRQEEGSFLPDKYAGLEWLQRFWKARNNRGYPIWTDSGSLIRDCKPNKKPLDNSKIIKRLVFAFCGDGRNRTFD